MSDSIKFRCQKCGVKIEADSSYQGSVAECPVCGNVTMIPVKGVFPGMQIDDFKLEEPLGSGILGEVWLADQISMKRPVAIKILSPAIVLSPKSMAHFIEDIKNVGKLNHPYIVPAIKAGSIGQIYYLAYEYVKGKSIASMIADGKPLEESVILKYAESIAEALMYAWNKHEILHRDLSPDHVIIDSHGRPMIIDMGISKTIAEDASVTQTGLILGSPPFMSPELVGGKKEIDCRTDIFSLGAIIYSMATGSLPYENLPPAKLFMMQLKESFPSVKAKNPKASDRIVRLVEIMTARKKTYRQRSWEDVIYDIRQAMTGKMPETPQPPSLSTNVTDKFETSPKIKCSVHPKRAKLEKDSKAKLLEIYSKSPEKHSPLYLGILIAIILFSAGGLIFFHYKSYTEENLRIEREHRVLEKLLELTEKRKENLLQKKGYARVFEARKLFKTVKQKAETLAKKGAYDEAISVLEKARIDEILLMGPGNAYVSSIEKDLYHLKNEKEDKLEKVIKLLTEEVEKLDTKGKYAEAASILEKYKGPLAAESAEFRSILIMKYKAKAQYRENARTTATAAPPPPKPVLTKEDEKRLLKQVAEKLITGALDDAITILKRLDKNSDAQALIKTIEMVKNRNIFLTKSFCEEKGKKILLSVNDETREFTVKDVKDEKLFLEDEVENGVKLVFPVSFKDITTEEKISRLAQYNKTAAELYKGIIAAKRYNYDDATEAFSRTGAIAPFLKEVVEFAKSKYHDNDLSMQ